MGEFALVTVDRTRVEHLAEHGDRSAARVLAALRQLSFHLSGAQFGITVTSIVLGFVGEPVIARLTEPVLDALPGIDIEPGTGPSVVLALAIATTLQMVIGELVPKSWAIAKPLGTSRFVVVPFAWFSIVFGPIITVLNGAANLVLRAMGIEPREELIAVRSLDELDLLIRSSVREGTLTPTTFPFLTRAIGLTEKTAAAALVPRTSVVAIPEGASVADLVAASVRSGHSRFPVARGDLDEILGTVHVKDAARVPRRAWAEAPVLPLMSEPVAVPESRPLPSLFSEMRARGHQMVVVVDEYGGTAGILTVEDILEEIVGEIEDEHDPEVPASLTWAGTHVVSAMLHADELREETGFRLPDGDYETMGGYLLASLGHIPRTGEVHEADGWRFEVVSLDGHRIDRVRVTPPPGWPGPDEVTS